MQSLLKQIGWNTYRLKVLARWLAWDTLGAMGGPEIATLEGRNSLVRLPSDQFPRRPSETRQVRLVCVRGPVYIEPEFGFPIAHPAQVLTDFMPYSAMSRQTATMQFFSGVPSFRGYLQARRMQHRVRHVPELALLRHPFDENYYHLMIESFPAVALLVKHGLGDVPLLISERMSSTPVFREVRSQPRLRDRRWSVQSAHEWLVADRIYVPLIMRDDRQAIDDMLDLIDAPSPNARSDERIFLTRNPAVGRAIINMDELRPLLRFRGLREVDTAEIPVREQAKLFSEASLVVGIHGAGLTNVIFRRGCPCKLVEIFPPHDRDPSFYLLAKGFGHDYRWLAGSGASNLSRTANFSVKAAALGHLLDGHGAALA